ncbi:MAG: hypothetical protein HGA85_01335 [Nanoarchaeota archaeon]|nr:hypothetical protein [Nanoarchaeota archaeon]
MKTKAESQYLSWILVMGMVVALSFMLYNWSIEQATKASEALEKMTDPLVCAEIGVSLTGSCQTPTTLELNVTNTNNLEIIGLLINTIGLYPEDNNYLGVIRSDINIAPGESEYVIVLKQGTLSQAKITPVAKRGKKSFYCEEKSIVREQRELKQC